MQMLETFTKELPVRLTEDELLQKAHELAEAVQNYGTEERRQVDIKAQMKARLTEIDARRTQLAITVARKEEDRDVRCEVLADFDAGQAQIVRTDTGEIISRRLLTDTERQRKLPMEA